MVKSLALVLILVFGIAGTVFVIQKSTLLKSFGYDVVDFSYFFNSSEGEAEFNPNMDIYQDGRINTMDVLKDRYAQEATRAGIYPEESDLSNILESSDSAEASGPGD